jgi:hypothetical protein
MLEIKYKAFEKGSVDSAVTKIANYPKFPAKEALKIFGLIDELALAKEKVNTDYLTLVKEHAKLDEKGKPMPREDFNGRKIPHSFEPKDRDAWDKVAQEFSEKVVTIKAEKIPLDKLTGLEFTPLEMAALEPILDI